MDGIELNENWYPALTGTGFSHDPYEVACFALGFVTYELLWEVPRPWLREGTLTGIL